MLSTSVITRLTKKQCDELIQKENIENISEYLRQTIDEMDDPPTKENTETVRLVTRVSRQQHKKLKEWAEATGKSISQILQDKILKKIDGSTQ